MKLSTLKHISRFVDTYGVWQSFFNGRQGQIQENFRQRPIIISRLVMMPRFLRSCPQMLLSMDLELSSLRNPLFLHPVPWAHLHGQRLTPRMCNFRQIELPMSNKQSVSLQDVTRSDQSPLIHPSGLLAKSLQPYRSKSVKLTQEQIKGSRWSGPPSYENICPE